MEMLIGLFLGLVFGRSNEKKHLKSLAEREASDLAGMRIDNRKRVVDKENVISSQMVCGNTVIATDAAKIIFARFRGFFGGEIRSYTVLMERARREALLRMVAEAKQLGAKEVCNVRFGTSNLSGLGKGSQAASQVEVIAYGTAVLRQE